MRTIWARLLRTLKQSRIRLPPARRFAPRPGDRLEIEGLAFEVRHVQQRAGRAEVSLFEAAGEARLLGPPDGQGRWRLERGGTTIELAPAAIFAYPAATGIEAEP